MKSCLDVLLQHFDSMWELEKRGILYTAFFRHSRVIWLIKNKNKQQQKKTHQNKQTNQKIPKT